MSLALRLRNTGGLNYCKLLRSRTLLAATSINTANRHASSAAPPPATVEPNFLVSFWQTFSDSKPVAYMQDALIQLHDSSGLPWWATIGLSTILLRTCVTLPLTIYQMRNAARLENLTKELPALVEELKREAAVARLKFKLTDVEATNLYRHSLKKVWTSLIVRDNCHPMKSVIVVLGQIPLWICQSVALRNLVYMLPDPNSVTAQLVYAELLLGGFLWIPNLIDIDHSYILPVALGLINLTNIELQVFGRLSAASRFKAIVTNVVRGLSLVMVPIACTVPSALCVYWVASASYGLAQNVLLLSPKVRRAVGIQKTSKERETPYADIYLELQRRVDIIGELLSSPLAVRTKTTSVGSNTLKQKAKKSS